MDGVIVDRQDEVRNLVMQVAPRHFVVALDPPPRHHIAVLVHARAGEEIQLLFGGLLQLGVGPLDAVDHGKPAHLVQAGDAGGIVAEDPAHPLVVNAGEADELRVEEAIRQLHVQRTAAGGVGREGPLLFLHRAAFVRLPRLRAVDALRAQRDGGGGAIGHGLGIAEEARGKPHLGVQIRGRKVNALFAAGRDHFVPLCAHVYGKALDSIQAHFRIQEARDFRVQAGPGLRGKHQCRKAVGRETAGFEERARDPPS